MKTLKYLPEPEVLESRAVFQQLTRSERALAQLRGEAKSIPNESILINTLSLQEAKDSSQVEGIVTTQDEMFQAEGGVKGASLASKEVAYYGEALRSGFFRIRDNGFITNRLILDVHEALNCSSPGYRTMPGTALRHASTREVVYMPPPVEEVQTLMDDLVAYINKTDSELNPLTRMAIIHHQFESIHPFIDGNGRTGRILNVLFLVQQDLLSIPVLYLSRYINRNKTEYYARLQDVRDTGDWEPYLLYMLRGVEVIAVDGLNLIEKMKNLILSRKNQLRDEHANIYSQDLINNLFKNAYTKIQYVEKDLSVTRKTAAKYLEQLAEAGILRKQRLGRANYYFNQSLIDLLTEQEALPTTSNP